MRDKIAELLEVRKIIALVSLIVFAALAFFGRLEVSFYFGKATALDIPDKEK